VLVFCLLCYIFLRLAALALTQSVVSYRHESSTLAIGFLFFALGFAAGGAGEGPATVASPKKKRSRGRPQKKAAAAAAAGGAGEGSATVASPTKKRSRNSMGKEAAAEIEPSPNKKSKSTAIFTFSPHTTARVVYSTGWYRSTGSFLNNSPYGIAVPF